MRTMKRVRYIFCLGMTLIAALSACNRRKGDVVYIPAGYEGWVSIDYQVAASMPLEVRGSKYVVRVPPGGTVQTSTIRDVGYASDEFYFVSRVGDEASIPQELTTPDPQFCETHTCVLRPTYRSSPNSVTFFFVGPKSRVSHYKSPLQ
jgi:hypothetical protein